MPSSKLVGSKAFHVGNATESPVASTGADEPAARKSFVCRSAARALPSTASASHMAD